MAYRETGDDPRPADPANVVRLDRADDPRLAEYVRLRDVELRTSLEAEHGLFIAEGEKVIRRAVDAGYPVRSFLMAPRWVDGLRARIEASGAPCYVLPEERIEALTGFHVHRGALASLGRTPARSLDEVLAGARRIVVLEDVVDHTNVGAIFRSVAAFGLDAVILSPRCADPLYRRSVKVSMGAVFSLPYTRLTSWYDGPDELRGRGFRLLALTPGVDSVPLAEAARAVADHPAALLLGTEGAGLSPRWLNASDARVRIPIGPAVDSLNVAAAAAVACYEITRSRPAGSSPDPDGS